MRIKLRLEPYDPDARDADNDGIVQEGTAWERPAGAKFLDDLGNNIQQGLTSPYRNTSLKLVDGNGRALDYRPTYGSEADFNPKDSRPTLEKLGYQSLQQLGLRTVGDMVLPSTRPKALLSTGDDIKASTDFQLQTSISQMIDRLTAEGPGWSPGGEELNDFFRLLENDELPYEMDDGEVQEEIFRIEESARLARFELLAETFSREASEVLQSWIDGLRDDTYSIRDEIEDRFLKPADRAAELADLVSTDRNSAEWKREYERQLTRINRVQSRSSGVGALLELIDNSPVREQHLYRGMMLSPEQLDKLLAQGRINFPIGATSSRVNSALEYAGPNLGSSNGILIRIEGARAFPAHLFSRVDEEEFLVSGEFEIIGVETVPFRGLGGTIRQLIVRPTGRTYWEHGPELLNDILDETPESSD